MKVGLFRLVFVAVFWVPVVVWSQEKAARDLAASHLDFERAVAVHGVQVDAGPALLSLDDGLLVPATPVGGRTAEMVFLGRGRFAITPPDAIEAGQLEVTAGARRLDEEVTEAVFVVGMATTVETLLRSPKAVPDAARAQRCRQIWESWRQAPERRGLDVDTAILSIALGVPASRSYFAARLRSADLGEFVYTVDPAAREQVTVGRWTAPAFFQTWISASLRQDGKLMPGQPDFEPQKYTLTLSLADDLLASGLARIDLIPTIKGARVVKLRFAKELAVSRVTDGAGRELFFIHRQDGFAVFLAEPADAKAAVSLAIEYRGRPIHRDKDSYSLIDPRLWFPHTGLIDRALYDVTLRWPKSLDLLAGGKRLRGGEGEGERWEQRLLSRPAANFSFEIGHYRIEKFRAGQTQILFAFDPESSRMEPERRDEITGTAEDALRYYEDRFGPFPFDELAVVIGSRDVSQVPAPGLMTLSSTMTGDLDLMSLLYQRRDRRLVIARELARQWWGQAVGWASYRDQWLGEAVAGYAAARYAKAEITSGWQTSLLATLPNGRMINTLGPVVLGSRLGVPSDAAYRAIVLKKGAVVFDMLARLVEEHDFAKALRQIAVESSGKAVSTEDFLATLRSFTAADLRSFADEFIDGTVLPKVLYSYQIEDQNLKMRIVQQMPYRFHSKIVPMDRGGFDTVRQAEEEIPVRSSVFAAPYEVEPVPVWTRIHAGANPEGMLLQGASSEYTVLFSPAPQRAWIDRKSQVFALFFEEKTKPRSFLFEEGLRAAAAGQAGVAESCFDRALELPESPQDADTAGIEVARVRLLLDRGRDEDAAGALDRARRSSRNAESLTLLQARLDVRRGRNAEAFRALSHIVESPGSPDAAEAAALLAIAAKALGRTEESAQALRMAWRMEVDVDALVQ